MNTKNRLLQAAAARVQTQGFYKTTVDEIVKDVNISKATFYHHFRDKEELGLQLIKLHEDDFSNILARIFDQNRSGLEQIRAYLDYVYEECGSGGKLNQGCPLGNMLAEVSNLNDAYRESLIHVIHQFFLKLKEAYSKAIAEGELPASSDASALAKTTEALAQGAILLGKGFRSSELVRDCFDGFLHSGIAAARS